MKYSYLYIVAIILSLACSNKVEIDEVQAETFNKLYGGSGNDRGLDIRELSSGDYLIFGSIETSDKSTELALIKTDRFGNELWTKTYGRQFEDAAGGMDMNNNGNILITGTSNKSPDFATPENSTDIIVYELDENGNILDNWLFDYNNNEEGNCIAYDKGSLGGFMVCGSSDAERSVATNGFTTNDKFFKDLLAVRYYFNGTVIDTNVFQIGYEGNDEINAIIQQSETDNFLVAGKVFLQETDQVILLGFPNELNSVSNINENIGFELDGPARVQSFDRTPSGFAITGTFNTNRDNIFIQEIDGEQQFSEGSLYTILKNGAARGNSIAYDIASNSYIIAGSTNDSQNGGFDHYVASYSRDNNRINWERTYGGTGDEEAISVAPTQDGGYIITGYTGFEGNSLINTLKLDNSGILNP